MNKSYLLTFFLVINLIFSENIYSKEIAGKQNLICNGTNSYSSAGKKTFTFENVKESAVIYKYKLNRDDIEKQRPIGKMKFANSKFPPNYYDELQICSEDDLKLIFNSICTMSEENWPARVASLGSDCTLEKMTGKFNCEISVTYKNDEFVSKYWDYQCKQNKIPVIF